MREDEVELSVVELRPVQEESRRVVLRGVQVEIASETIFTIDDDGRQMTLDQYLEYAQTLLTKHVADENELRSSWIDESKRLALLTELEDHGVHLGLIADLQAIHDADEYDVIRSLTSDGTLIRRAERADAFLNHNANWMSGFNAAQNRIILELIDAYRDGGIDQLRRRVLRLERFKQHGGAVGVIKAFGGSTRFDQILTDLRSRLYPPVREIAA
jgi:type I restriction enzyme R subunit